MAYIVPLPLLSLGLSSLKLICLVVRVGCSKLCSKKLFGVVVDFVMWIDLLILWFVLMTLPQPGVKVDDEKEESGE